MIEWLKTLSPEVVTFFSSMLPFLELRFSIPFAMTAYGMEPWRALLISLAGNTLIAAFLLEALEPVTIFLKKHLSFMDSFFEKLFHKTRTKHTKKISELGHIALVLFVAIPLPGSGAWSGALIAYVFGIKTRIALPLISIGLIIAGIIVSFGTKGIMAIFV